MTGIFFSTSHARQVISKPFERWLSSTLSSLEGDRLRQSPATAIRIGNDQLIDKSLNILATIVAVLLRKKLVCTAPSVSSNGWDQNDVAYCHAMSTSRVGTKKDVGAEVTRSRNLVPHVSGMRYYLSHCPGHTRGI